MSDRASSHQPAPPRLHFALALDAARMRRARARIRDYLHEQRCSPEAIEDVVLAVEEAMANAVRHSGASEVLEVDLRFEGRDLLANIKDRGCGFDTTALDLERIPDPTALGGRGLFLMAQLMDDLDVCCDGGVEIRAVKRGALREPASSQARRRWVAPGEAAFGDLRRAALLDEVDEAVVAYDWEYRYVHLNTTALRFARMAREDLLGRSAWEVHPEAQDMPQGTALREAMELGSFAILEYQVPTTGDWVETRFYPTSFGVTAVSREITERKLKELERDELLAALAESDVRYRSMADGLPFPVWISDADGATEFVNGSYCEFFGREGDEVLGNDWRPFVHPDDRDSYVAQFLAASQERRQFHAEVRVQAADGTWHWVESFASPRYSRSGEFLGMVGCSPDITERRLATEALHDSEVRLRLASHGGEIGLYEWNVTRDAPYWGSPEAYELFGLDPQVPVTFESWLACVHPDDRERLAGTMAALCSLDRSKPLPGVQREEYRVVQRDGRVLWLEAVNTVAREGASVVIRGGVRDVTDRKVAEQALREAARLAEALASIDALVHSSLHPDESVEAALREGAAALGAHAALVTTHSPAGFRIDHLQGGPQELLGRVIPDELDTHGLLALRSGETLAIEDVRSDPRVQRKLLEEFEAKALLVAPLIQGGEGVGCLYFAYTDGPHVFARIEVDFVGRLAASLSLALENARLFAEQQRIALTLQENFVHRLPAVSGLELGAVSQPAATPELVGGDFSDVFLLAEGRVAILIGDVAGKGVRAAGLTETVRSTVRAFATIDSSPTFVLRKTSEALLHHDPEEPHVTAFFCVLDPSTGHLAYASAGHPSPVHLGPFSCSLLAVRSGPPLGTFARDYENGHAILTLEDYLVLYTDGVTEARHDGRMLGEQRLLAIVALLRGRSAQELADGVRDAAEAYADALRDDLQVVVLRLG